MKHFLSSLLFFAIMTILVSCTANSGKSSQTERCFDAETVTMVKTLHIGSAWVVTCVAVIIITGLANILLHSIMRIMNATLT